PRMQDPMVQGVYYLSNLLKTIRAYLTKCYGKYLDALFLPLLHDMSFSVLFSLMREDRLFTFNSYVT
ncbi:hypothetical protein L9F63_009520, partial [Diploptera punctata]